MKVREGRMISSPSFIPRLARVKWRAAVPFETAIAYPPPRYSEKVFSNLSVSGPVESHLERRTLITSCSSYFPRSISESG
jgi:hypothetical protein